MDEEMNLEFIPESDETEEIEDTASPLRFCDPILLDIDKLAECTLDKKEFQEGLKAVSRIAGMYVGLVSVGMTDEDATTYIFTKEQIDYTTKLQEDNNKTSIEVAKYQTVMIEKNQL